MSLIQDFPNFLMCDIISRYFRFGDSIPRPLLDNICRAQCKIQFTWLQITIVPWFSLPILTKEPFLLDKPSRPLPWSSRPPGRPKPQVGKPCSDWLKKLDLLRFYQLTGNSPENIQTCKLTFNSHVDNSINGGNTLTSMIFLMINTVSGLVFHINLWLDGSVTCLLNKLNKQDIVENFLCLCVLRSV